MVEQEAVVIRCEPHQVWLEADSTPCAGCRTPCASAHLLPSSSARDKAFSVATTESYAPGERVVIGIAEGKLLRTGLLLYLLPLIGLFAGALLGDLSIPTWREPAAILGGVAGLALTLAMIRLHATGQPAELCLTIRPLR